MPMEVFTISGSAGFGASSSPTARLQNALKALGDAHGDSALSSLVVDGALGPKTVTALNYALHKYIGAGAVQDFHLGGRFLNATATKDDVQKYLSTLATVVERTVKLQGGALPDVPDVSKKRSGSSFATTALAPAAVADNSGTLAQNPNLVWIVGGGALLVVALGFMAAKRRAAA